jgi:aminoglycoside N3'-acetyltransferase
MTHGGPKLKIVSALKRSLKTVLPHQKQHYKNMLLRRVNEKKLATHFEKLGIGQGSIVYIQSALGGLGYYPGGAHRLIRLLSDMVGDRGTIVMPSFPTGGAMEDHVAKRGVFDARNTRSNIGILPEVLRQVPGARRSCHPSHPVVALGYQADEIVADHELCLSPQGDGSPFDKLVQINALVLRIGTPAYPLCHRLQEIVQWPNLFWPEPATIECITDKGDTVSVSTLVYRKRVPFVFFLPGNDPAEPVATNIIDFPIISTPREDLLESDPEKQTALKLLTGYKHDLAQEGYFIETSYNDCVLDICQAEQSMKYGVDKASEMIGRFRDSYDFDAMTRGLKSGHLRI